MYKEWPFFSVTLDMIEMVFAKADPRVAQVCFCPTMQVLALDPIAYSSLYGPIYWLQHEA